MSYKFSGTGNSQSLDSPQTTTNIPAAYPVTVAGWAQFGDFTVDETPFVIGDTGAADAARIQISTDGDNGAGGTDIDFVLDGGSTNQGTSLTLPSYLVSTHVWLFICFVLRTITNRQGYAVGRGTLYEGALATTSIGFPSALDKVTFGYLPFFGNLNAHQGRIGPWGMWERELTTPEIIRMGRGDPLENHRTGMIDMWKLDGRIVSRTIHSLYRKKDLTVTGPPAYSLNEPPINYDQRRPKWRAPAAPPVVVASGVVFPARMDGLGHGGIFPGNRL